MPGRCVAILGGSFLALLVVTPAAAKPFTYVNERFGTAVTFPAEIFSSRMEPPANGDGLTFLSPDGASLAVFGMNNALEQTPAGLIEEAMARSELGYRLTYSKAGRDWAVLSGFEAGLIFYERFEFGASDVIHAVLVKYPAALKSKYDPLIGAIAGSLEGPSRRKSAAKSRRGTAIYHDTDSSLISRATRCGAS